MGPDFHAIRTELRDPSDGAFRNTAWLQQSWAAPDDFTAALLKHHALLDPEPIKSDPQSGYDLYHDLVIRHARSSRIALYWFGLDNHLERLSYKELHIRCTAQRAEWLTRGVQAGQRLCVLAELGAELLVPLLTGLRMGLEVSLLPPAGTNFLQRRLEKLEPDWVATARRYLPLLRDTGLANSTLVAPTDSSLDVATVDATSHTYAPAAVALRVFSPAHNPPDKLVAVTSATAYHGALRDGLLLLDLHPGQVVATAEQSLLQMQPAMLFSTLMRGAALLKLQARDFASAGSRDNHLARLPPIDVLFVNAALREVMLQSPPLPAFSTLKLWIKDPQELIPQFAWDDWVQRWGLQRVPVMSLLLQTACGGSVLFSRRRCAIPTLYLMPTPGRPFVLLQPDDSGDPARAEFGVFTPSAGAAGLLLTRMHGGYLYGGTREPTQDGSFYPKEEVEQAVADLPFVRGASVVQEPGARGGATLLVFTGPETLAYAQKYVQQREHLLRQAIISRLLPEHLPNNIILAAQLPRWQDAAATIDHAWCSRLLQSGDLSRRDDNPVYALLDRLLLALAAPQRNVHEQPGL